MVAVLALTGSIDLIAGCRRRRVMTVPEAIRWLVLYLGLAVVFGAGVWWLAGGGYAGEFFGGYLTEYALSADNLLVFMVVLSSFKVPELYQHRALLIGIVLALLLRIVFIVLGVLAINTVSWLGYLLAACLLTTAVNLTRRRASKKDPEWTEPKVIGLVRRFLPMTGHFVGARLTVRVNGKRWLTPMLLAIVAVGVTDVFFALDSIPAIFGITREPFLIVTANALALMALRQLYVLLHALLKKLVYLSYGLAAILAFIGIKMVLQALQANNLPLLNNGAPVPVPDIGIGVSLAFIAGVLATTTLASLLAVRRNPALAPINKRQPIARPSTTSYGT
jgi:tellurite resistance protein TerC